MKILALDFSSSQRSVALVLKTDATPTCTEYETVGTGGKPDNAFGMIEEVLNQAGVEREQVEGLVVGLGPGSYTGIRAAIALAQGWVLARPVRLQGLSSAACLAAQAHAQGLFGRVAIVIDAQRGEFYLANYELSPGTSRELQPLRLASRSTVAACQAGGELLVGPALDQWFPGSRSMFPRAATLGAIALSRPQFTPEAALEPIYLRKTTFVRAPPQCTLPE